MTLVKFNLSHKCLLSHPGHWDNSSKKLVSRRRRHQKTSNSIKSLISDHNEALWRWHSVMGVVMAALKRDVREDWRRHHLHSLGWGHFQRACAKVLISAVLWKFFQCHKGWGYSLGTPNLRQTNTRHSTMWEGSHPSSQKAKVVSTCCTSFFSMTSVCPSITLCNSSSHLSCTASNTFSLSEVLLAISLEEFQTEEQEPCVAKEAGSGNGYM